MSALSIEHALSTRYGGRSGVVVTCALTAANPDGHESRTRAALAERIARLKGLTFAGEFDEHLPFVSLPYFVPSDALLADHASRLGVTDEHDLFGGVVGHAFAATKAITHPLLDPSAFAPPGWSHAFPQAVASSVLDGVTVFTRDDLRRAVLAQLERSTVRVKRTLGIGGSGQYVVGNAGALDAVLDEIDDDELTTTGIVVEENLESVTTFSVGQVRVAGIVASYLGTQRLTRNNRGNEVYGGSRLHVVRGDFDALLRRPLSDEVALAVAQARNYDGAADRVIPGFFASRRNYDVVQGRDARGRAKSGVLEQSWRIGGASGAEVTALEAFDADPTLMSVRASTIEVYGDSPAPPPDATIYFRDVDPRVGFLTKYSRLDSHADT